jgi:hypothetical protein
LQNTNLPGPDHPRHIGKGKARGPYAFGVKVSLITTNKRCKDCKTDGHLDHDFPRGPIGDRINAVTSAIGTNLGPDLKWPRTLPRQVTAAIWAAINPLPTLEPASQQRASDPNIPTPQSPQYRNKDPW